MIKAVLTLALLSAAHAAAAQAPGDKDRQELERMNAAWLRSYETRDPAALRSILADDFIGLYGERALTKAQMLDGLVARPAMRASWDALRINVNGDTATVSAISTIVTIGKAGEARFNYADVYARRGGQWKAVASHVVRLPTPEGKD